MVQDLWNRYFGPKANPLEVNINTSLPEWCNICNRYIEWDGHTGELHYKALLKEAHDKMDDMNAELDTSVELPAPRCKFCLETGYNANGLIHTEDCIIQKIRRVLS